MPVSVESQISPAAIAGQQGEKTPAGLAAPVLDLILASCLVVTELLCFAPMVKKIGFYLDDWATFAALHFAKHDFFSVLQASLADPRMVTRPFQCLYYASTYMLFGDAPGGYHLVRLAIEACGAVFLYLGLRCLTTRSIAVVAALLFIVFPSHDSSHYWIGAGLGAGCGMTLFLLSFWLLVASLTRKVTGDAASIAKVVSQVKPDTRSFALSLVAFALCAYCYEAFLPMLAASGLAVFYLVFRSGQSSSSLPGKIFKALMLLAPFVVAGVSEPIYQRVLVPAFTKVFLSPGGFDPSYFFNVFVQGLNVSLGPAGWTFFGQRAAAALSSGAAPLWQTAAIALVSAVAVWFSSSKRDARLPAGACLLWTGAASTVLLCSYLTFAVAQGYLPVLDSMINRVNMGASAAACLILAVVINQLGGGRWLKAGLAASLVTFLALADFGCAPYWQQSWQVQKRIQQIVKDKAADLTPSQSLLLINTPRYVMWAPVFDGVWDFQSMVWLTLNNHDLYAGVVSERLSADRVGLQDKSSGFLCASYRFDGMKLLVPSTAEVLSVDDADQFLAAVKDRGMGFGLSPRVLEGWYASSRQ